MAQLSCDIGEPGVCGDPNAGSCYVPHATAACDDATCCAAVCAVFPSCCDLTWDVLCAGVADDICVGPCQPSCPGGSIEEGESCEQNINDPCYFPSANPTLKTIPCGGSACGHIHVSGSGSRITRDVDVWRFVTDDADGDGLAAVQLSFTSGFEGYAALVPAVGCPELSTALTYVESSLCFDALSPQICVPVGEYRIVVTSGVFPDFGATEIFCDVWDGYVVQVACNDLLCAPPCNPNGESCYRSHTTPGCNDVECCESICASDPICCDINWDGACAAQAVRECADPPANDTCATASPIAEGVTEVVTLGAMDGALDIPTSCLESGGAAAFNDVWYTFKSPRDAFVEMSTCGDFAVFNPAIAIYSGTCGNLSLVTCDDDAGTCLPTDAPSVLFEAECGTIYYVRVGGGPGAVSMTVTVFGGPDCPDCPADLDGSGDVGAADIAILLGSWGGSGPADLDGSGSVGSPDLAIMLGAWGPC
jgi:hypothetical protein